MRTLFFIAFFFALQCPKPAYSAEVYRYFSAPTYVHTFENLKAKIWILINRIPELQWQKVEIPPARREVALLPKVILLSGRFTKEGKGKRSLIVNGTKIKVSESGEFVLRVLIEANEFGLLVNLKDLDQKQDTAQTVGLRIIYKKKEENRIFAEKKLVDFAGKSVFTQRKIASLDLFPPEVKPPEAELSTAIPSEPTLEEKLNWLDIYLGTSFGTYQQHNFESQSPKNSFVRVNFESNLKKYLGSPIFIGADTRLSLLALSKEKNGTLQFLNPELKIGIELVKTPETTLKLFTGTTYFSSFGNSLFGLESAVGQSLQANAQFRFAGDWRLNLFGRFTWVPSGTAGGFFSSREFLGGLAIGKDRWGIFSEASNLSLKTKQNLKNSALRFGLFVSF